MSHSYSSFFTQCHAYASLNNARGARAGNGGFMGNRAKASTSAPSAKNAKQLLIERQSGVCQAAAEINEVAVHNVEDIMTKGKILTCSPDTTLDEALEMIVEHHVTGLPVCDRTSGQVVGVISDFDLLALEGVSAKEKARGFFPDAETDWNSFFEIQKLVAKNAGRTVADVMTADPITVRPTTSIVDAANLLLRRKIRRLPVVDENGVLVGIITRSNVIYAAWQARKAGQHL